MMCAVCVGTAPAFVLTPAVQGVCPGKYLPYFSLGQKISMHGMLHVFTAQGRMLTLKQAMFFTLAAEKNQL